MSVDSSAVCWRPSLLDKSQSAHTTPPECEWHLLVNRACGLSTCWCDPSAPSVTLCSVLQPRYAALRPGFVQRCGFPGSDLKEHGWPRFCVCKKMTKDAAPRQACCYQPWKSSLSSSQGGYMCVWVWVSVEKGGGRGWGCGLRKQAAENPTYLPRHPQHAVWIAPDLPLLRAEVWPHLAAACLQSRVHGCVLKRIFIYRLKDQLSKKVYGFSSWCFCVLKN